MRISGIKEYSHIYGFEPCFVIWMQGCPIRCKGCWNNDTWEINGGYEMAVQELFSLIQKQRNDKECPISALTILGGEPFFQYEELKELVSLIKTLDIGIIVYSGYEKEELIQAQKDSIFNLIDVLIYGPYIQSLRNTNLHLRGSSNQVIDFLSTRYNQSHIKEGNYIEIDINEFGKIDMAGYIDD